MLSKVKLSDWSNLILCILLTAFICMGLTAVLTRLVLTERVGELGAEIGINLTIILAIIIGGAPFVKMGNNKEQFCLLYGVMLLLIVVSFGLAIDGKFENVFIRIGSIVVTIILLYAKLTRTGKRRNKKNNRYR